MRDINYVNNFSNDFREAYSVNPKKTIKYMEMCLREMESKETIEETKNKLFIKIDEKKLMIFYLVVIFICALFFSVPLSIFGLVFFFAGHFVVYDSLKRNLTDLGDIIFLFSHGLVGLVITYISMVYNFYELFMQSNTCFYMLVVSIAFSVFGIIKALMFRMGGVEVKFSKLLTPYVISFTLLVAAKIVVLLSNGLGVIING